MNDMRNAAERYAVAELGAVGPLTWTWNGWNWFATFVARDEAQKCYALVAGKVHFAVYDQLPITRAHAKALTEAFCQQSLADNDGHLDRQALADEANPNYVTLR